MYNSEISSQLIINSNSEQNMECSIKVAKEYPSPKKPGKIVSDTLIVFLRAVFDENFQKGHWYLNPLTEMYIRDHYPEDSKEAGIKPGIIQEETGGIQRAIRYLGELNFLPMHTPNINILSGNDEVFSGTITLKAISTLKEESEKIAYLSWLSINMFVTEILGINGIAHIDSEGHGEARPSEISTKIKLWESLIPVRYVIKVPYSSVMLGDDRLGKIDEEINY